MPLLDGGCEQIGQLGRVAYGIVYVKHHGHYFGSTPVVLSDRRGADGKSLSLQLDEDFLEENNLGLRFGLRQSQSGELAKHLHECGNQFCGDANKRAELAGLLFERGFPDVIALRCAVETGASSKSEWAHGQAHPFQIPDDRGYKESADFFEPYFRWFDGINRKDWVWPKEIGWPRLFGHYFDAKIDKARQEFAFRVRNPRPEGARTARIPLEMVRKLRIRGSHGETTWFNPGIYHIDTLTDPENQGRVHEEGTVKIWLREEIPGIVDRAKKFLANGVAFSLETRPGNL